MVNVVNVFVRVLLGYLLISVDVLMGGGLNVLSWVYSMFFGIGGFSVFGGSVVVNVVVSGVL